MHNWILHDSTNISYLSVESIRFNVNIRVDDRVRVAFRVNFPLFFLSSIFSYFLSSSSLKKEHKSLFKTIKSKQKKTHNSYIVKQVFSTCPYSVSKPLSTFNRCF